MFSFSPFLEWIGRIHQKNTTIVRQLDDRGFTPLHHATSYWLGNDLAEELLKVDKSMAYVRAVDDQDRMTALHLVARQGNESVMEKILEHCPDCWDMTTSNCRNILHLASEKRNSFIIRFILMQPWSVNLIDQVDKFGNTPLHLLLHSVPYSYGQIKDLVEHPKVDFYVINVEGDTPYDMVVRLSQTSGLTPEQISIMEELQTLVPLRYYFRNTDNRNDASTKEDDGIDQKRLERLEEMKRNAERHLVVAALIATVTFAAGFTLPGGYDGNSGPNQGMAVSINRAAFKTFVVTNTLAVISSYAAIFLYFAATFYKHDKVKLYNRYESALVLLLFSMITMVIAFITGMFTVLDKSLGLAVTVSIIGSLGILFLLYLVHNTYQDLKSHNRNPFEFRPLGIEV
ncbi:hypothetical protein Leryth_011672 [Lithospermum erythrorhizon]|nr:hypothetical protein Leryth_011672 [Lithospermum erythrorhizon]